MSRYAPALIQIAIALVGALAQVTGRLTLVGGLQLAVLAANALLVYLVPLFGPAMRSGWKTGVAVLGALVAAFVPVYLTGQITGPQIALVVLAGLQALGAHIGVQIRNDSAAVAGGSSTAAGPITPAGEPPTDTTMVRAIDLTGGEAGVGTPAR